MKIVNSAYLLGFGYHKTQASLLNATAITDFSSIFLTVCNI